MSTIKYLLLISMCKKNRKCGIVLKNFMALLLLSFLSASAQPALVLYWNFNEETGSVARDNSGFGLDGELWCEAGGTLPQRISSVDSAHGKALRFGDNLASSVWRAYDPRLDLASNWTIACWVRQDNNADATHGGYPRVISAENYELQLGQAGDTKTYWWPWSPTTWEFVMWDSPALGQWHHIAVSYDGTTFKEYIDGTQVFTKTGLPASLTRYAAHAWQWFSVGCSANFLTPNHVVGAIDDVAVWNETLTQTQIQTAKNGDFSSWTTIGQEAVGINYFDLAHSDAGAPTCWDNNRSVLYLGSPATFTNCNNAIPVDLSVGKGSLVLTTTYTGGWWSTWFNLDWGHSVNYLRYGSTSADPLLYLRLKWGAIATGADVRITLRDSHDAWNAYDYYAGQPASYIYHEATVNLSSYVTPSTTTWQDVYIPMSDFLANNPNIDLTRISILILQNPTTTYSATNTLYIEKLKVVPSTSFANGYSEMVKVNQLGYVTNGRKLAFVSYEAGTISPGPTYFQVKTVSNGHVAYTGNLSLVAPHIGDGGPWDYSNDTVYDANFTSFNTPGRYVIYCPELAQTSPPFDINDTVYNKPLRDVLRYFYYARCSDPIAEPYAEGHTRPTIYANNVNCAYDYSSTDRKHMYNYDPNKIGITTRDVSGGLFDAGDLHLDIHDNIGPMWFLLETYKDFKDKVSAANYLNLPESNGQTNDLVLLIKRELDWFKKMQNSDGSVHFIVISEVNDAHQNVSDVSTGAACVLAGVFAKASALFSNVPGMESYSADLLSRAQLSWSWLQAHPATYDPKGANGTTWSYGITNDISFRSFAAIELYIATGNSTYRTYFETAFNTNGNGTGGTGVGGDAVTAYGDYSNHSGYLMPVCGINGICLGYLDYVDTTRAVDATIANNIKQDFLSEAALMRLHNDYSPYNLPVIMQNDISWGTSGYMSGNAYVLLRAYKWTNDVTYRNAALDVLDHIGGRNPVARVFITGNGYSDYLHGTDVYSFYWFDLENPVPGYLCGNINVFGFDWGMHYLGYYIKGKYKYYLNIMNPSVLEPGLPSQAMLAYLLGYFAYNPVTGPGQASSPSPADNAADVSVTQTLSWTEGSGATSNDVYFGTNQANVTNATHASAEFKGSQPGSTYNPGTLSMATTYYWRIDGVNNSGTTKGTVWSFTTLRKYTEKLQDITIAAAGAWTDVDLTSYGVPANAVVEIGIRNSSTSAVRSAGVRIKGSSIDRRVTLHSATTAGWDTITMQVKTDANRKIQAYAANVSDVHFYLIGVWNSGSYTERYDTLTIGTTGAWTDSADLTAYGVAASNVVEVMAANTASNATNSAGIRAKGSALDRRLILHKSQSGGSECLVMQAQSDASRKIQVYKGSTSVTFVLLGYWTTSPGTFTEKFAGVGKPSSGATWTARSLSGNGVPANATCEMLISNGSTSHDNNVGVRRVGSSLNRLLDLHKSSTSGSVDCGMMHVEADASSTIQQYLQNAADTSEFYLLGYWN